MSRHLFRYVSLGMVMLLAVLIVSGGCSKKTATPTSTQATTVTTSTKTSAATTTSVVTTVAPTTSAAPQTLEIGLSNINSGAGASWGLMIGNGAKMTADEINKAGGIKVGGTTYLIKFIDEDNKYTADGAVAAANKLISVNKVKYIVAIGGTVVPPTQTLAEPANVMTFAAAYTPVLGPSWPLTFRVAQSSDTYVTLLYKYIRTKYPQAKVVAMINRNDAGGWDQRAQELAAMQVVGGFTVAANVLYEYGTKEFSPFVTSLLASKPDVVDTGILPPGDAALVIEGLRQGGYNGPIVVPTSADYNAMSKLVGKQVLDGCVSATPDWSDQQLPKTLLDLRANYIKLYGEPFGAEQVQYTYDTAYALKAAMEAAGSIDVAKVKAALEASGFAYKSMYGTAKFAGASVYGIAHQGYRPVWIAAYQNGSNQIVASYSVDDIASSQALFYPIYKQLAAQK